VKLFIFKILNYRELQKALGLDLAEMIDLSKKNPEQSKPKYIRL